jgi:recombination protein RecA
VAGKSAPKKTSSSDSLDAVLEQINSQFGAGSIMRFGEEERRAVEVISTGSIALNEALGIGGLPRGRIIEAYGPESSGKSSMALHAAANVQAQQDADGNPGVVAYIDAEHAFDPDWAEKLGVDTDALLMSQPDTGEQALEIADMLVGSAKVDLVIIDSVAALVPRAEIEGQMGDSHVGLQARLMSQALRKIAGRASQSRTTVFFINQLREKVGVLFGSPETTSGGKALKFYASVRLDVRRIETLKDGTEEVGSRVRVKVVKNKMARPFRRAEFDFLFACGISRERELIDLGVERKVLTKSGSWHAFNGEKIGNGKTDACRYLTENPGVANDIELRVYAAVADKAAVAVAAPLGSLVDSGSGTEPAADHESPFG